jgi:hypothetical protein
MGLCRWVPCGYGQQNMYIAPHICSITNKNGGKKPRIPALVPGTGVRGPKQMVAAFQAEGNNVEWSPGETCPTYTEYMGYMPGKMAHFRFIVQSLPFMPVLSG